MSVTIAGTVVAADGCALWRYEDCWGEQRTAAIESTPANTFASPQPACAITLGHHGRPLGEITYLESGFTDEALRFVGVVDVPGIRAADLDGMFVSPNITSQARGVVADWSRLD